MLRKILSLAFILLFPLAAAAQKRSLSLEEAVGLGLETSPRLHASRMKQDAAAARTKELAAGRLPSLSMGAAYSRLSEVPPFRVSLPLPPPFPSSFVVSPVFFNTYTLQASLRQPLFTGFRLEAGEDAARYQERSAAFDLENERAEFVFSVKSAYWSLVRAAQFVRVIEENAVQVETHLKDVRAFFDQGLLTKNEVLRVEVQRSNIGMLLLQARNGVEMSRTLLNSLIGLPLETELETTTAPESAAAPVSGTEESSLQDSAEAQAMLRAASSDRPDLKSADFRIRASEEGVRVARAAWYPQVFLSGNYYYLRPNPRLLPTQDKFYGTWDVGVSLSLNLWNWNQTKFQTAQAKAQLAQAKDARKLLEDAAALDVTQSRLALIEARRRVGVAAETVLQAQENLRITREKFREGLALNADVLDAETTLLQAELGRTQAAIDVALAQARLQKALGR